MVVGNSSTLTSKRAYTSFKTSVSLSDEMKEIARPFVPKRPALPTRWRY